MYTVYMHTCLINNKRYIGITKQVPYTKRFNGNGSGYKNSIRFWNAIKKYGWDQFIHTVLAENIPETKAKKLEKFYIKLFRTEDDKYGYNILQGGQCGDMPQETKEKIRQSSFGKPGTMLGKNQSEETKRKISEAQKGRHMTAEHYKNFCKAMEKRQGNPGRKLRENERKRLGENTKIRIKCLETQDVFESMTSCAEAFSGHIANLSRAIKYNKPFKGKHFEKLCS